jgi:hypothetical protein
MAESPADSFRQTLHAFGMVFLSLEDVFHHLAAGRIIVVEPSNRSCQFAHFHSILLKGRGLA